MKVSNILSSLGTHARDASLNIIIICSKRHISVHKGKLSLSTIIATAHLRRWFGGARDVGSRKREVGNSTKDEGWQDWWHGPIITVMRSSGSIGCELFIYHYYHVAGWTSSMCIVESVARKLFLFQFSKNKKIKVIECLLPTFLALVFCLKPKTPYCWYFSCLLIFLRI